MELRGKRILLFSPEPWHGLHMSKHHLSQELAARGNSVFFLDPPRPGNRRFTMEAQGDVTVVRYRHWLRGVNRLPLAVNRWYYKRLVAAIARRTGGPFDIVWCFDTSRMQSFPDGIGYKLLHLADYDILYIGQDLIPTADIILTTSKVVADEVRGRTKARTIYIGHALDGRWLKGIGDLADRAPGPPRSVVFAGQLAISYNDWEGFHRIAQTHRALSFTFIGPYDPEFPEPALHGLLQLPNVTFAGLMTKDQLIPHVRSADILLFGFRSGTHARERANPHKVLEYLSTGNVIVGSYTMDYVGRDDLMCMAPEGGDLNATFEQALKDHQRLNERELRSARIDFARERTMDHLIQRIERELGAG